MEILLIIGGSILTILATCIGERLLKFINQKIRNETVRNILRHIKNIILDNVKSTQQCCVDELKKNNEFNKEEQAKALEQTRINVLNSLSKKTKENIQRIYGDIDQFIICQIEAAIYDLKN